MRNFLVGGFAAVALLAVAACTGGNSSPSVPYPGPTMVGAATLPSSGGATITLPATTGFGVGTAEVYGSGSVGVTQSASNPSGVPVLQLKQRQTAGGAHPNQTGNTPIAYVTVTASSTTSLSQVNLTLAPTATIPSGTYYLAFWNGTQWVTVGSPASIFGGVVSVSSGSFNPPVALASGASFYLAIYTGQIFSTPSPPPPAPVASPSALTLSEGQTGTITVTSGVGITIAASSSNTSVATVTASANTGTGTTATFTVTAALTTGTSTITFTDPLNRTVTVPVTVNNTAPTPQPSPATATIGLGDVAAVGISALPNTAITIQSASASIAPVNTANSATGASGSISVMTSSTGAATFYVVGLAGGVTSITLTDPYNNVGTMNVTVSAVTNGAFVNGSTGWTPCSYGRSGLPAPVNAATPLSNTPEPAQTAPAETPVPAGSLPPITTTAPPANDNPSPNPPDIAFGATAPPALGNSVALAGTINASTVAYPKGTFGMCQQIAVPAGAAYLSFWVWEGGSEYTFKYADQEAVILDSTGTTVQETLFAEQDCYLHPSGATPPGIWGGTGVNTTSGCWPSQYGGDVDGYMNWIQGGFWAQRGPFNLATYAGQTVTLFLGNWSNYADSASYYAQFMYVGSVQMTGSSTFPTTGPLTKGRTLTVALPKNHSVAQSKPIH